MTKKDYTKLAAAIREVREDVSRRDIVTTETALRLVAIAIGDVLKSDNANFDRARFESAIGGVR